MGALGIVETFSAVSTTVLTDTVVQDHGLLVSTTVIPRPSKELYTEYT